MTHILLRISMTAAVILVLSLVAGVETTEMHGLNRLNLIAGIAAILSFLTLIGCVLSLIWIA